LRWAIKLNAYPLLNLLSLLLTIDLKVNPRGLRGMGWCSPYTVYFLLLSSLSIYIINEISKKVKTYFKRILYTLLLYFNAMKRRPARPNVCSYKKKRLFKPLQSGNPQKEQDIHHRHSRNKYQRVRF